MNEEPFVHTFEGHLWLQVILQAEQDLIAWYDDIVAEKRIVEQVLAGRANLADPHVVGAVTRVRNRFAAYEEVRAFFVNPPARSLFPLACAALGENPRVKRAALTPYLYLPWSGYQLRKALGRRCSSKPSSAN